MKQYSFFLLLVLNFIFCKAQEFKILQKNNNAITIKYSQSAIGFSYKNINSKSYIQFSSTHKIVTMEKGFPSLPIYNESFQIASKGQVKIETNYDTYEEFFDLEVLPSKGNLKRNVNPETIPYKFGEAYQQNSFYPAQLAVLSEPFLLHNKRGVTVSVFPYSYNPITKVLRVYKNITIKIIINALEKGINETDESNLTNNNELPSSIFFQESNNSNYAPIQESGDLLILCPTNYLSQIQPLVDWKNQKGIKTTIISNYGATSTAIKSAVQNFYATNPTLKYILIVGDHQQIPSHTYGMADEEQLWSDSFYGQLTGTDFFPEAFVGRLSGSTTQVADMVTKILNYEKTPLTGNWMQNSIGIASDEGDGYGDEGQADYIHLNEIKTKLVSFGYNTVDEFYQGSQGGADANGEPTPAMVAAAINNGAGLLFYTGHGDNNSFVTSDFSIANANNLTNTGKYPFIISVACNNGTFTQTSPNSATTCLGESFLYGNNKGAIAFTGSSILQSWAPPMETQDEVANYVTKANPIEISTLGGIFFNGQMSMLENYNNSTGTEVMQTWVFFGDPSVTFRSKTSLNLTVSHPTTITSDTTSLTVQSSTPNIMIAVSQNNILLGRSISDNFGNATITFPSLANNNNLLITGTKQNFVPYQSSITISTLGIDNNQISKASIYPNPTSKYIFFNGVTDITNAKISLYDSTGKLVHNNVKLIDNCKIDVNYLTNGIYFIEIKTTTNSIVFKSIINK